MKRKLVLVNLALLALIGIAGWRLRGEWLAARAREQAVFGEAPRPQPSPPAPPLQPVKPLVAADYSEIAQKMLFARDRNPNLVLEIGPAKPMPPLPVLYGVVDLGDGTTAILSEKSGAPHRAVLPGQKVGEFNLAAVNHEEIVLEWEGGKVTKKLADLIDRSAGRAAASPEATPRLPSAPAAASTTTITVTPAAVKTGPGEPMGGELRACVAGDTSPSGTVVEGMRKLVTESLFGKVCRWEPAR